MQALVRKYLKFVETLKKKENDIFVLFISDCAGLNFVINIQYDVSYGKIAVLND